MKAFECFYSRLRLFEHPLHQRVHRALVAIDAARLLDVGGRRSNYTIGLRSEVWLTDIPRERELQKQLDLGADDTMREKVLRRRSNVVKYLYDDMTSTTLPPGHFDAVSAIEVLEHVDEDARFVENVARLLKPGGHFLMTTPNGDWKATPYADHKRHYRAVDLEALLRTRFSDVRIEYRVNAGGLFDLGYRLGAVLGMPAYGVCAVLERLGFGGRGPARKHHLLALCTK